ncbi:MAG: hypothetical protein QM710_06000 [Flavobacterium sp.]
MKKITPILLQAIILLFFTQCHYTKKNIMKHKFSFYTQYNQFYLADKDGKGDTGSSNFWTKEALKDKLALEKGIIGVGTQSYGEIRGEIEILEKPSDNVDYGLYDHVVEGGIDIKSGELQVLDCPNSHLELKLKLNPGKYRVRVYGSNFDSVIEEDLANDTDNDFYKIEIWPDENLERKVLKQYIKK